MTIEFITAPADANKGFRIGREQSLFANNVTFKVTGVEFGNYEITEDDGTKTTTKYASTSQSIRLTTDLGEPLSLSRLLHKRTIVYDKDGRAFVVEGCTFKAQLRQYLEELGRRANDPSMLNGTVEEVGKKVFEFFKDKTLICREIEGLAKDKNGVLQPRLSPCIQFEFFN